MTQEHILVSPLTSARPKTGAKSPAFRPAESGDTQSARIAQQSAPRVVLSSRTPLRLASSFHSSQGSPSASSASPASEQLSPLPPFVVPEREQPKMNDQTRTTKNRKKQSMNSTTAIE